jgi:hypothetical protein
MGILDDAIREHLELKRQHGAPEEELKRQEDEALGPPRREVAQRPEGADEEAGEPIGDGVPPVPVEAPPTELADTEEPSELTGTEEPGELAGEKAPTELVERGSEAPEPAEQLEPKADHPPAHPAEDHGPDPGDPFGGDEPFSEQHGDEAEELDDEEGEPDVLEDTPDFLQETPEHDRLWFEQKPPRDFDFE